MTITDAEQEWFSALVLHVKDTEIHYKYYFFHTEESEKLLSMMGSDATTCFTCGSTAKTQPEQFTVDLKERKHG